MADSVELERLLDGLDGAARDERAELIAWLLEQGIGADEIGAAAAPLLLATRRLVGGDDRRVSTREIADAHGIDLALLQRVQRATGLARVDDPDDLVTVVRVLAEGLANASEVMRSTALAAVLEPGATELEIAKRSQALVAQIAPLLGPWIEDMLFMHLRHQMETEAVTAAERAAGNALPGARDVYVAFADLVGFTQLGEQVPPEELQHLADRLADHAREVAVAPVRFVKTIGDAAMFVCTDAAPLLDAALALVDAAADDAEFPLVRAGVAAGPAISRAGDWLGSAVNLASRVTETARPGSVLVTDPVRTALGDAGFHWSVAGARRLKGITGAVRLFRARRQQATAGDA